MELEADAERWEFLRQWLEPLRGCVVVERRVLGEVTYHALKVAGLGVAPAARLGCLDLLRGASVLFAALDRVGRDMLRRVLLHFCNGEDDLAESKMASLETKEFGSGDLMFHIDLDDFDLGLDVVKDFFGKLKAREVGQLLEKTVSKVYALAENRGQFSSLPLEIPITMSVYDSENQNLIARWWNAVKRLVSKYGGWRFPLLLPHNTRTPILLGCNFTMTTVRLDASGALTTNSLLAIEEMVTSGNELVIEQLYIFTGIPDLLRIGDVLRWGRLFEKLVCSRGEDCAFVDRLQIGGEIHRPALMGRWYSAFAELLNVVTLGIYLDCELATPEARALSWQYLAYAFFSKHACSHLESLKLNDVILKAADADAIAELLASPDPTNFLYGYQDGTRGEESSNSDYDDTLRTGMLKKGTIATLVNTGLHDELSLVNEPEATWTLSTDVHHVKVLRDDGNKDFARVLIPGYGVNKVKHSQIRRGRYKVPKLVVDSLRLSFIPENLGTSGLPRALELIGSNLTKLYLEIPSGMDTTLPRALVSCVNLKALRFRGDAINSRKFLDVYRDSELNIQQLDCSFDDIVAFTDELSNMSTRIAQQLKRMACYFDNASLMWEQHGSLKCVSSMLMKNRRLEIFQLPANEEMCEALEPELGRFNQVAIPVEKERFPSASRLAFLSIFMISERSGQERNPKRLKHDGAMPAMSGLADFPVDRLVFSKIFSFAGTCARRHVLLTPIRLVLM